MRRPTTAGRLAAALTTMLVGAACAAEAGPPEIVLDDSACARCGMLISEPRFAAAYRAGDRSEAFDDIGCLLDALDRAELETEPSSEPANADDGKEVAVVWFLDADERWREASEVVFVRSSGISTPMTGGVLALADRDAAESIAARGGGQVVTSLAELRAWWRASRGTGDAS